MGKENKKLLWYGIVWFVGVRVRFMGKENKKLFNGLAWYGMVWYGLFVSCCTEFAVGDKIHAAVQG